MERTFKILCTLLTVGLSLGQAAPNSTRIVGGDDANIGQFPYQISLQNQKGDHVCGGSILNKRYVLTAAHCVVIGNNIETYPPKFHQVRVGSIQRTMGGEVVKIKRIIVNKDYRDLKHDLALLELEKSLTWSEYIQPIELASKEAPSGGDVIISGWGQLSGTDPAPNRLQWNTVKALTYEDCKEVLDTADESFVCLVHEVNNGACFGDSGGPATYNGKLIGVCSFVIGDTTFCGLKYPDGYANVAYHLDWILENMAK